MSTEDISFADLMASSIHDMKNSVNVQVDTLEALAAQIRAKVDAATFQGLVSVIAQAQQLDANMIQLLSLYKFGKSIYPLDMAEHPVADVLQEVGLQKALVLSLKGIAVEVDCAPDCSWYFDRDLVTGVLLNALNNAYTHAKDKIRMAARVEAGMLTLRVEDNGPGYPCELLQGNGVEANKGVNFSSGSTGLGLYFSLQVALLHQNKGQRGSLTIENGGAYGGGCLVLRLP